MHTPCLLRENFHGIYLQWPFIFIPKWIYTVCPQRELSRIFPLVALQFYPSMDLYRASSERTFLDFALSGFIFLSLGRFISCLLRENIHGFCPQWLCFYFHPLEDLYCVSSESRILPSVALYFYLSVDLYRVSSERMFTDFAFNGFLWIFITHWIYTVSPQRELSRICLQWFCVFIPQRIYIVSP